MNIKYLVCIGFVITATTAAAEPRPIYFSAGLSEGLSSLSNAPQTATSSSGSQTELLALASWRLPNWEFEAGAGWFHSSISGTAQATNFGLHSYDMTTNAGVAEISPRYRLTENLQAGPVMELLFGSDVGFAPDWHQSGQSTAWLAGGQALYEFRLGTIALKPGVRYLASLNVPGHLLQSIEATLQFCIVSNWFNFTTPPADK